MCYSKIVAILFFLLQTNTFCLAQVNKDKIYSNIQLQTVQPNSFDKKEWGKLKKKLKIKDYKPTKKETPAKESNKKDELKKLNISQNWRTFFKWTMFSLLIGTLLFLVLRILGINPFNKKAESNAVNISLEELEENLNTASIDPHLYTAIKNKNFNLAIRLYYLMIIQKLAMKEKISWKKYKTNKHYLNELRDKNEYQEMQKLTLAYEINWFGETDMSENEYHIIYPDFVNFLQNIK